MKGIILYIIISILVSCGGDYNPHNDSDHVNKLNSHRLHSMLQDMIYEIQHYNFTHDPDIDYVGLIKIHHTTAVMMARREKEWGRNEKMIALAKQIIQDESGEIEQLDTYEHAHKPDKQNHSFFDESQKILLHEHTPDELGNIDQVFAEIILKHHQSAVAVSRVYLKYSNDPTVRDLALHVIDHHSRNIRDLQSTIKLLKDNN